MLIHLHRQATTTPKVRAAIQASDDAGTVLAERFGVTPQTIYKWRKRDSVEDRSHTPHRLQTTLTPAQEAVAVALRKTLLVSLDDLELLLFPATPSVADGERPVPDWSLVDRELRRPGVTRALLWEEYRAGHPFGFGYAWFCEHYEAWKGRVRPTMRQTHVGGEKVFVDFAGDMIDVINPATGEVRAVKLFVAAMGASNYTYAEAVASEGLEDWIEAHVRMFTFLGGVPKVVVPDNLKSAVFKADRFDPGLNRTYAEMAGHYGTAILPARPYKPRDKAKVEVAVQVAQRWILARLRNLRFFSLANLNAAIRRLLDELNVRVMRGYGASRADLFATIDRPNLQPLPLEPYAFARWKRARVAPDYHVEVDSSWYSVPFALIRQEVDVRVCGVVVEIFHKGKRVASHPRCPGRRSHVTVPEHMPSSHRRHAEWTPARVLAQAEKLGPSVTAFCEAVMADRPHPEQGFRSCRDGLRVCYHRVPKLFEALAIARGDGRHARMLKAIERTELLILDDLGLSILSSSERRDMLEILEDRHGRGSTIVTSQLSIEHWHEAIGDPTLTDAILDRLVHNAHRLPLTGESLRKRAATMKPLDPTGRA